MARRLGDPAALAYAAAQTISWTHSPVHWQERLRLADEFRHFPFQGVPTRTAGVLLQRGGDIALARGDRAGAEAAWAELRRLAERTRYPYCVLGVLITEGELAILDGRLQAAIETADRLTRRAEEVGALAWGLNFAMFLKIRPLGLLGQGARLDETLHAFRQALGGIDIPGLNAFRVLTFAHAGRSEESLALLEVYLSPDGIGRSAASVDSWSAALYLEAALVLGAREQAARLAGYLEPLADAYADITYACIGRLLGEAAVLNVDTSRARGFYERGLALAQRIRARPETALLHLDLAEVLAPTGTGMGTVLAVGTESASVAGIPDPTAESRTATLEHLSFAIPELEAMGMQPALERAQRLRERLNR